MARSVKADEQQVACRSASPDGARLARAARAANAVRCRADARVAWVALALALTMPCREHWSYRSCRSVCSVGGGGGVRVIEKWEYGKRERLSRGRRQRCCDRVGSRGLRIDAEMDWWPSLFAVVSIVDSLDSPLLHSCPSRLYLVSQRAGPVAIARPSQTQAQGFFPRWLGSLGRREDVDSRAKHWTVAKSGYRLGAAPGCQDSFVFVCLSFAGASAVVVGCRVSGRLTIQNVSGCLAGCQGHGTGTAWSSSMSLFFFLGDLPKCPWCGCG